MPRFALLLMAMMLGACSPGDCAQPESIEPRPAGSLTSGDRAALRALDKAYAKAWLVPDAAAREQALMALFAEDVVVYPGHGTSPIDGKQRLRAFWFAEEGQPAAVEFIEHDTLAIEGSIALAAITGHSRIAFLSRGTQVAQEGHYIIHARPDDQGYWKIERMMWNARAPE